MLCRLLDILYYKQTPPPMFQKPFKSAKSKSENEQLNNDVDLNQIKIDDYIAQSIMRETTEDLQMLILNLVMLLIKCHRGNSERLTKYFNTLYQHYHMHENFFALNLITPEFKTTNPRAYMRVIGEIFKKAQKNSMFVFSDRTASTLVEFFPTSEQKKMHNFHPFVGIDSNVAIKILEGSTDINQI